jgi:transcriptional regulator with XRE-family HTH domain
MAKRLAQSDWTAQDLQSKREALGMSKAEMARRVGVSYRQYMYYERGQTKISRGLESFVEDLLNPKGNDNNKSQGTLSDFEKDRITRLLNALQNHPLDDLDDKTQKILRQTSEEIVLLLSKLSN